MIQYLKNLIPRLSAYGKKLDNKDGFVDKKWTILDELDQIKTYRFKRNGDLRISTNGDFTDYQWDLDGDAISIKEFGKRSGELYRHGFILDGLLVLQKEGTVGTPTIFYNEDVVVGGEIENYIRRVIESRLNLKRFNDDFYISYNPNGSKIGGKIFNNNYEEVAVADIVFQNQKFTIRNGVITRIVKTQNFSSNRGVICIETYNDDCFIQLENKVNQIDGNIANGKYIITNVGEKFRIYVKDGVIKKVKTNDINDFLRYASYLILCVIGIKVILHFSMPTKIQSQIPPLSDSANADAKMSDSIQVSSKTIPPYPDSQKQYELKELLGKYFNYINNRRWDMIFALFPNVIDDFYNQTQLSSNAAIDQLRGYWDNTDLKAGIILAKRDMEFTPIYDGYKIVVYTIEMGCKGDYKIPVLQNCKMTFIVNSSSLITSINIELISQSGDFYRMFDLDHSINIEDYKARNSQEDWNKIFKKIKDVGTNTPSVAPAYINTVLDIYGTESKVIANNGYYHLAIYLKELSTGLVDKSYCIEVTNIEGHKEITVF